MRPPQNPGVPPHEVNMVINFIVITSSEEDGVTGVVPFPALLPAKKTADKIKKESDPWDVVVWDVVNNTPAYSPPFAEEKPEQLK